MDHGIIWEGRGMEGIFAGNRGKIWQIVVFLTLSYLPWASTRGIIARQNPRFALQITHFP
jgi:hypothetical protein